MTIFELWILTTALPGISCVFGASAVVVGIVYGILLIKSGIDYSVAKDFPQLDSCKREIAGAKYVFSLGKKILPLIFTFSLISSVIPNEKQMLLIAGGYTATNNEQIKQMPTKAAKAVNAWLDAVTEAAEPAKK